MASFYIFIPEVIWRSKAKYFFVYLFILSFLELNCSPLRLIENGYFHPVKQTYEEGDVIQFFCHENYHLSGSDLIQCYNFGWYPESPVCEGKCFCFSTHLSKNTMS